DLEEAVGRGAFREDLYYRLSAFVVYLPPLRERSDDITLLARHFVSLLTGRLRRPELQLSADALALLQRYSWPGNVRQLRNALERAAV
ncbi:Fis family transcriptional regulator, partial [Alkalihalobacillus clausii]|nr:Fis family transcriptional regulator [Shouchella clausii]